MPDPNSHQRLVSALEIHHSREELDWRNSEPFYRVGSGWPIEYRQLYIDSDSYSVKESHRVFVTDDSIYTIQCFVDRDGTTDGLPPGGAWLPLNRLFNLCA